MERVRKGHSRGRDHSKDLARSRHPLRQHRQRTVKLPTAPTHSLDATYNQDATLRADQDRNGARTEQGSPRFLCLPLALL